MKQENKIVGFYPLTKFYLAIVLVVLDIIMPGILSKLVVFVIINIIVALSDVWKSFIRKVRNSVGVLFVILLFIQTFFYPRGEVIFSFWIFNAKLEGILFALKLGITLMGVGGSLIWFFSDYTGKGFCISFGKERNERKSFLCGSINTSNGSCFKEKITDNYECTKSKRSRNGRKSFSKSKGFCADDYSTCIKLDSRNRRKSIDIRGKRIFHLG